MYERERQRETRRGRFGFTLDIEPKRGEKWPGFELNLWLSISSQNKPSIWRSRFQLACPESICLFRTTGASDAPWFTKAIWGSLCLVLVLWAARWSCVRTLNYSAIPQQIEAVMCKTTWPVSSCAGEHQWMCVHSLLERCYQVMQLYIQISLMHNLGLAHNLLQRWNYFFLEQTQSVVCFHREGWES